MIRWPVAALAVLVARTAAAEPVTLGSAIDAGAQRSPGVIEAERVRVASSAFADHPGGSLPSAPQAIVEGGVRDPRGLPLGPEIVLTVQQEVSFRGLGRARRDAATWTARAATAESARARIEGATTAALEWIELIEAQELLRVRIAAETDALKLSRIAEARVVGGVATGVDRSLALAEVGAAQLAMLDAEGQAQEARLSLAMAMGRPLDAPLVADGRLEATNETVPDGGPVLAHALSGPAFQAVDARAKEANAQVAVAHATQGPNFFFGVTAWREGSGDKAATANITVPLPFFDPTKYESARQATIAAAMLGHAEHMRIELEREVRIALHEREHTREVRATLFTNVLTPLKAALATATTTYAAGSGDLTTVLLARRSALAAEERSIVALADVQRADVKLAALAGTLVKP